MSITKIKSYVRQHSNKQILVAAVLLVTVVIVGMVYFAAIKPKPVQVSSPDCAALINTARPPTFAKPGDLYNELKSAESYCLNVPKSVQGKYQKIQYLVSLAKVAYAADDRQSAYAYAHKAADDYGALSDKEKQGLPDGQSVGITVMTLLGMEKSQ